MERFSIVNGRERLLATLRGQPTDRVAIAPFLYFNSVYELFDHVPDIDNFTDPADFDPIVKFVEYCDYFGFDVMHNLGSDWGFYMFRPGDNWDVVYHRRASGRRKAAHHQYPDARGGLAARRELSP